MNTAGVEANGNAESRSGSPGDELETRDPVPVEVIYTDGRTGAVRLVL